MGVWVWDLGWVKVVSLVCGFGLGWVKVVDLVGLGGACGGFRWCMWWLRRVSWLGVVAVGAIL